MEVAYITNNISIPKANPNTNIDVQTDIPAAITENNNNNEKFDYSTVMMDLEEIQDFLFMLIGSVPPAKAGEHTANAGKGINLNLFA